MALSQNQKDEIRERVRPGMTAEEWAVLAAHYSCTVRTLLRVTRTLRPRRRRREDLARDEAYRAAIGDELLAWLVGLMDRGVPAPEAIAAARANAKTGADEVSPYRLRRALLAAGWSLAAAKKRGERRADGSRAPEIVRRVERRHANSLHQYDETRAPAMYVDERDGGIVFDPLGACDPAVRSRGKSPLWVAGLMDDASRAAHVVPIRTPSAEEVLEAFAAAWSPKSDSRLPLCGMPALVYADNGSWCNSETVRAALEFLEVDLSCHRPYRPWAKGKIERLFGATNPFWILDQAQRTRIEETDDGGVRRRVLRMTPDDVARLFLRINLYLGNRQHRGTGEEPFVRWSRLVAESGEPIRLPPPREAWEMLKLAWTERTVDQSVRIRLPGGEVIGLDYQVLGNLVGKTVKVGFRRRERDRPVAPGETIVVVLGEKRWEVPRREWAAAGSVSWEDQPRTSGEILAAKAALVDYSQDDLTLHMERGAREFEALPAALARPFDPLKLTALMGQAQTRMGRLEAIDRLQSAGLLPRPMTAGAQETAARVLGLAETVSLETVHGWLKRGKPPEADRAAGASSA